MDERRLRVHNFIQNSMANGPFTRSVLWVQGCDIGCAGCINPATHLNLGRGMKVCTPEDIIGWVPDNVEGITLTGGEPFQQPQGCAEVAELAQARGLGVVCFTGYYELEIKMLMGNPGVARLYNSVDLLIAGPWVRAMEVKDRPLISSSNQKLIHLSDRYRNVDLGAEVADLEMHFDFDMGKTIKTGIKKG